MIRLLHKLPKSLWVASSGGVDSMAALDFLRRRHRVRAAFFDHGTNDSKNGFKILYQFCSDHDIFLHKGVINDPEIPAGLSTEEHYRNERYKFLTSLPDTDPVVLGHHLDDAVETWVWGMCHGQPRVMDANFKRCMRPFLTTNKQNLVDWCIKHQVPWHNDASNNDVRFSRNQIRHRVLPELYKVNQGLHTVIKKKIVEKFHKDQMLTN